MVLLKWCDRIYKRYLLIRNLNHCMNCGLCRNPKHKLPYLNESETPDYLSNGRSTLTQIIQDAWLQNRFVCTGFTNMHCEFWESTLNWNSYCPLFLDAWTLNWRANNFCPQSHTTPNPKPQSFRSGSSGKECLQCKGHRRLRFDPWVGKIPWIRK